jgi:hypothetical protein
MVCCCSALFAPTSSLKPSLKLSQTLQYFVSIRIDRTNGCSSLVMLLKHLLRIGAVRPTEPRHTHSRPVTRPKYSRQASGLSRRQEKNGFLMKSLSGELVEDTNYVNKLRDGPTVLINSSGLVVKMICPSIHTVSNWSPKLATLLSLQVCMHICSIIMT